MCSLRVPKIPVLDDISPRGKKVLLRVDFNSPINPETGEILDTTRIQAHVPTIRELLESDNAVVLLSHQGRPGEDDFTTLEPHSRVLERLLNTHVEFVEDVIGPEARRRIEALKPGEILVLDNTRFVSEEIIEGLPEKQAKTFFVRRLAPMFDYYVNDAFATAHRSQPSIVGFPVVLPSAAGRLMEREVEALARTFNPEESPKIFVLGGGKVHDSIRIIENLVRNKVADRILTTGLLAELFLVAKGVDLGEQNMRLLEEKGILALVPRARKILLAGAPIETPIDFVVLKDDGEVRQEPAYSLSGLVRDIGTNTVKVYSELMNEAKIIVMRGPAGVIEDKRFRAGTYSLIKAALASKAFVVFGGGHFNVLISELDVNVDNAHLSTGGGALLLFLAGEPLPALEALSLSAKKFLGW